MNNPGTASAARPLPLIALLGLCMLAPLSALALSGMAPVMPMIGKEFAGTPGADMLVRLMMSGLSAAMIAGALLSGMLASRVGQMRLLMIALSLYALSGAAIFFLDNLHVMVACRMIQGVANAAAGVLVMALITTRVPPHLRDKWLGFYTVAGTFGVLLLIGAVGALAAEGWRYTFLLFLIALPVALLIYATLPTETGAERAAAVAARAVPAGIPWVLTLFGGAGGRDRHLDFDVYALSPARSGTRFTRNACHADDRGRRICRIVVLRFWLDTPPALGDAGVHWRFRADGTGHCPARQCLQPAIGGRRH